MIIDKKLFARVILSLIVIIPITFIEYKYWTSDFKPQTVVKADGVITEKHESYYSCGSKSRSTCYVRYFKIDGKMHNVTLKTFTTKEVGDHVILTVKEEPNETYMFLHFLLSSTLAVFIIVLLIIKLFIMAEFIDT